MMANNEWVNICSLYTDTVNILMCTSNTHRHTHAHYMHNVHTHARTHALTHTHTHTHRYMHTYIHNIHTSLSNSSLIFLNDPARERLLPTELDRCL